MLVGKLEGWSVGRVKIIILAFEVMITTGKTSAANVRPAASGVAPPVMKLPPLTKIERPRMPYTTDGTPARLRMFRSMNEVSFEGVAYSSR